MAARVMQIRLLGHVEASLDERPVALGGAKQRAVLAMLGLEANRPVTADRLIEGLWGEEPPPSAAKMVQNYVWRLRKALGADGGAEIVTRGRAYELQIDRELVDACGSSGSSARRRANGDAGDAARQALALFRGEPLADIADEPFAGAEIRRLEELRLTAAELAIDADLAAGRHQEVVGEIEALLADNPLRERLHAQRMLALYRCGRQAEALEAYRHARDTLVEQIGIEPGPELQRLHAAILRQDPALDVEPRRGRAGAGARRRGRAAAGRPRARAGGAARAVARGGGGLVTLAGAYGMGKTRLAAELARECRDEGAAVLYASGDGPAEVALATIARARAARRPTLLVLDDADRAPVEVRRALRERRRDRRWCSPPACRPRRWRGWSRSSRSCSSRSTPRPCRDRRPVRPARQRRSRSRSCCATSRGVAAPRPRGRERMGAPRGDRRVDDARRPRRRRAQRGARARARAGRQRRRPAVDARARRRFGHAGDRPDRGRLPVQGPGDVRPRRRRVLLRPRGARRRARRPRRRRAAARGRRPVRQRQVVGRRAPGCCPRSRAGCCRAARTGRRP